MQQIEVEIRGLLNKNEYNFLKEYLKGKSDLIEEDNRTACFFIIPNMNLKITKSTSKGIAKIALKSGNESQSICEEIEVEIKPDDFEKTIEIIESLGFTKSNKTKQVRTNYYIKDMNLSLKWSDDWGYHFEIDTIATNEKEAELKKTQLIAFAGELHLTVLSNEEIEQISLKINEKHHLS